MVRINLALLVTICLTGCGGDDPAGPGGPDNVPPTLAGLADQTIVLNTMTSGSIVVELNIDDPDDDSFSVTAVSSDPAVLPDTERTCGLDPCALTLTPIVSSSAAVDVTVTVSDGRGGETSTSFRVDVAPRLVSTATDDGAGSLRRAIGDAETGDVIGFDTEGTFGSAQTIVLAAELVLNRTVTIVGPGTDALIVSGDGATRVFRIEGDAVATLRDLTMAEGFAPLETLAAGDVRLGGCVFVDAGASLTLDGVRLTECSASDAPDLSAGGGAAILGGTLDIRNSQLDANSAASNGGAVYNTGALEIVDTELRDNVAAGTDAFEGGGALYNAGTAMLVGSDLAGNTGHDGGAIFNISGAVLTLRSVTLEFNVAASGGGGVFSQGELTVDSSSVRENEAGNRGGGIDIGAGGRLVVEASDVTGNTARWGGGIRLYNYADAELRDTRVTGNAAVALQGGGIFAMLDGGSGSGGGRLAIQDSSSIDDNLAADAGGGIFAWDRAAGVLLDVFVQRSSVSGNQATYGGGIFIDSGFLVLSAVRTASTAPPSGRTTRFSAVQGSTPREPRSRFSSRAQ